MTLTRLVAYTPNGASLGPLPTPLDLQAAYPLNDVGAASLEYPVDAPRAGLLGQPLEVAVETSTDAGQTWAEPIQSRFLYLRDGRDPIRSGDSYQVDCPAYGTRLTKAVVGFLGLNTEGRRAFTTQTVGAILHVLLTEAQTRGALTGLTWNFSATLDSAGAAWGGTQNITYEPGKDLLSVLQEWAALGLVDWTFQGRQLRVFKGDTAAGMAPDKSVGATPVVLRAGRDLTEAPFRRTWEGLANVVMVVGDEGKMVERTAAGALVPWGRQESYVSAAGVTDTGTLNVIGDASLTLTSGVRTEYTHGLDFGRAASLPFRDYTPGAWVFMATDGGAPVRVRVRQITLTRDSEGRSAGNAVLNDRFLESDIMQQRRIAALTSGATIATGGTPTPVGNDILRPAQVVGLAGSSAAYLDGTGAPRAQVSLDWTDVTTNVDGTAATDIAKYEVQGRKSDAATLTTVGRTVESNWQNSPYDVGTSWVFRVRALDTVGNEGAWSTTVTVAMAADATPPAQTSTPTALQRLGTAQFTWDGKAAGGGVMDPDLAYVELHVSTVAAFVATAKNPVTQKAVWVGRGASTAVVRLDYGTTYYAVLVPFDTSGNQGPQSAQATVAVTTLVDVANFPDPDVDILTGRIANFLTVNTDMLNANAAAIGLLDTGVLTSAITQTQLNPATTGGGLLDSTGFYMYPIGGGPALLSATKNGITMQGTLNAGKVVGGSVFGSTYSTGTEGMTSTGTTAAPAGERIILRNDGSGGVAEFYAGILNEIPGIIDPIISGTRPGIRIRPGYFTGDTPATLTLQGSGSSFLQGTTFSLSAAADLSSSLSVQGRVDFYATAYIAGLTQFSGSTNLANLTVNGGTVLQSTLAVSDTATFSGRVIASGLIKSGDQNITATLSTQTNVAVSFASAFPGAGPVPQVQVTPQISSPQNVQLSASNITRAGFTLWCWRSGGASAAITASWTAVAA